MFLNKDLLGSSSLHKDEIVLLRAGLGAARKKLADTELALQEELQDRRSLVMEGMKLVEKLGMEESWRKRTEADNEEAKRRSEELAP